MDFLDPNKKRAQRRRLIIGYVLIGVAIALVTIILGFQTYGYDLDRKTGAIIQNGLLFVAAQPEPANVFLNGKQYKTLSDAKLVLPSDVYKLELTRSGYRTWTRTFSLAGGSIERLVYPFMFPVNMQRQIQKNYTATPTLMTQSPDRRWVLVQQPGQLNSFDQYDTQDVKKAPTTVTLPNDILTQVAGPLSVVEWSTDNKHLLLKHEVAGNVEYIVMSRDAPATSVNLNKAFKQPFTSATLRDKNPNEVYLFNQPDGSLTTGVVKDASVKPVASNVLSYVTHGSNIILYATGEGAAEGKARIMYKDAEGTFFVREVTQSPQYLLAIAQYDNHWLVGAGGQNDDRVYVYKDPQAIIKKSNQTKLLYPETILRVDKPQWISFSANTQFLTIENGPQFATFDAEHERTYRFNIGLNLDEAAPHATWMDGDRLIVNSQATMVVFDFDGTNLQKLVPNQAGLVPAFDRDYQVLFNTAPNNGGTAGATFGHVILNLSKANQ